MTLNLAMGCNDATALNFVSQIKCGVNSFVHRYNDTAYDGRSIDFSTPSSSFFFRILDDLKKTIRHRVSQEKTERVAFGVMNRAPYMQFRYTPWIQSKPNGGGRLLV